MTQSISLDPGKILALNCPKCVFLTLSLAKLCEHCSSHQDKIICELFQCSLCGVISSNSNLMVEHIQSIHPHLKLELKRIMNLTLNDGDNSSSETEAAYGPYRCLMCSVGVSSSDTLRHHYQTRHNVINASSPMNRLRDSRMNEYQNAVEDASPDMGLGASPSDLSMEDDKLSHGVLPSRCIKSGNPSESTERFLSRQSSMLPYSIDEANHSFFSMRNQQNQPSSSGDGFIDRSDEYSMETTKDFIPKSSMSSNPLEPSEIPPETSQFSQIHQEEDLQMFQQQQFQQQKFRNVELLKLLKLQKKLQQQQQQTQQQQPQQQLPQGAGTWGTKISWSDSSGEPTQIGVSKGNSQPQPQEQQPQQLPQNAQTYGWKLNEGSILKQFDLAPRKSIGRWRTEDMVAAFEAVTMQGMTLRKAARNFNVPFATLQRRLSGKVKFKEYYGPGRLDHGPDRWNQGGNKWNTSSNAPQKFEGKDVAPTKEELHEMRAISEQQQSMDMTPQMYMTLDNRQNSEKTDRNASSSVPQNIKIEDVDPTKEELHEMQAISEQQRSVEMTPQMYMTLDNRQNSEKSDAKWTLENNLITRFEEKLA